MRRFSSSSLARDSAVLRRLLRTLGGSRRLFEPRDLDFEFPDLADARQHAAGRRIPSALNDAIRRRKVAGGRDEGRRQTAGSEMIEGLRKRIDEIDVA